MPTYEYKCESCSYKLEQFQWFSEKPLETCPNCKKNTLQRLISGGLGFSIRGDNHYSHLGMRQIQTDNAEQKLEERMKEIT